MFPTRDLFTRHDLRCTDQRVQIFESLAACKSHPTAEQLHRMVAERSPRISLATVYNTLDALCRAGLCRRIPSEGGARYDADTCDHLHIVTDDGRLIDVPDDLGGRILDSLPRDVLAELERRMGIRVSRVSVAVHAERRRS